MFSTELNTRNESRKGQGRKDALAMFVYLIVFFAVSYAITIVVSGFYISSSNDIDIAMSWPRGVFAAVAICGAFFYWSRAFHKDSNTLNVIGSPIMLHILGTLTFVVSVFASIFSTHFLAAIQNWALRANSVDQTMPHFEAELLVPVFNPVVFFIAFVVTLLCLFIKHGEESYRLKKSLESEQKQQSKELRDAIRVAPPPYFTKMLADVTDQSEDFQSLVTFEYANFEKNLSDQSETIEEKIDAATKLIESQRTALRAVLTGFGRLARTYDNVNPLDKTSGIEYRTNLMLNLELDGEGLEVLFPDKKPQMRFASNLHARPKYCLVIDKRLSVRIGPKNMDLFQSSNGVNDEEIITPNSFGLDTKVRDALLPVYWDEGNGHLQNYNMIGAPTAIVLGKAQYIPDTVERIEKATGYNEEILNQAREYFAKDTKGRSIVSFPVATRHFQTKNSPAPKPQMYFGAINLYRNEKDIFSGDDRNFEFFSDFTRPLHLILGRMCQFHLATCFHLHGLLAKKKATQQ